MKLCRSCRMFREKKDFYKHRSQEDGLAKVCRFCAKKYYKTHRARIKRKYTKKERSEQSLEKNILKEAEKLKIPLNGLDKEKLQKVRIKMKDYPDPHLPNSLSHGSFMYKYNLTVEEYMLFRKSVESFKFNVGVLNES